jgi:ABC-type lipoprotein export system ATPase subunit
MATALDRGADDSRKAGNRKKRARRRAEAVADAAISVPIPGTGAHSPEPETQAPAESAAESLPVAAVRARTDRRRESRRRAEMFPKPDPEPEGGTEAAAPEPDEFHDLLGQAVGLRIDAVSRVFDSGGAKVVALREVSLEISPGEFVSVIGPSGCGKTTLLSLMGGLDKPTTGQVYAAGMALDQLSQSALADYRLQRVSTIFQTFNLVPAMTVEENVALPLVLAGVEPEERRARVARLLALVGLEGRSSARANRLSGGEQQKVAVARALANRPGLILADEPTGSLDSTAGERVLELLKDLHRRGATVVLVTHDPEVARHARRAVRMIDGRAFELGSDSRNVRSQDPVLPAPRLHWRDVLRLGSLSAGRRPLRTFLTTTGVGIGIAAMSLIVALSGGLGYTLGAPGLAATRLNEVSVRAAPSAANGALDAPTLASLASQPHVQAAWGDVALGGGFGTTSAAPARLTDQLTSLPPRAYWDGSVALVAGRMPHSDAAAEVVLSAQVATALGFATPADAIGQTVMFTAAAQKSTPLSLTVVGVASDASLPRGAIGGLAPYQLVTTQWDTLANANGWKGGEFKSVTLLADSDATVDGVRDRVQAMGFQAETTGDLLRGIGELLGRLRVALLGLSVVALLLACLGIANTMYTAVLERTREIGILKAVGARSRDVMLIFVAEAAVLGLAGGVLGAVAGALLARAGNSAVDSLVPAVARGSFEVFRPDLVAGLLALGVAVVLSMGSGLLPAMRAAAQEPMKALHHE